MIVVSTETEEVIRFEYEVGVRRKRELSEFRHRRGGPRGSGNEVYERLRIAD
jgi:hypothetical protein